MNLTQQLGYQVNFSGRFDSTAGLIFNRFNHLQINQVSCFTWLKELNRRVLTSIRILKYRTSNEILGWEGVGNRQLLCFFKA
jgi:hypothetical protein